MSPVMMVVSLLAWSFDRVEPPYAVLYDEAGASVNVPLEEMPPGAEPGDTLVDLESKRLIKTTPQERAALERRLATLLTRSVAGTLLDEDQSARGACAPGPRDARALRLHAGGLPLGSAPPAPGLSAAAAWAGAVTARGAICVL